MAESDANSSGHQTLLLLLLFILTGSTSLDRDKEATHFR